MVSRRTSASSPARSRCASRRICSVVRDILDSMAHSGFRRILIVNGHGGNGAVQQFVQQWTADHAGLSRDLPQLVERAEDVGEGAGDRSGRVARIVDGEFSVDAVAGRRACRQRSARWWISLKVATLDPVALRKYLGDGNFGGLHQRSDEDMLAIWKVAVEETRSVLDGSWGSTP